MRDGEHVLVSNRPVDFPSWFTLHPTEVSDAEAYRMKAKLDAGWTPEDVVDSPNVWRVCGGDRIAWLGRCAASDRDDTGELAILDCGRNLLVAAEGLTDSLEQLMSFGDLPGEEFDAVQKPLIRSGIAAAIALGGARTYSTDWTIG